MAKQPAANTIQTPCAYVTHKFTCWLCQTTGFPCAGMCTITAHVGGVAARSAPGTCRRAKCTPVRHASRCTLTLALPWHLAEPLPLTSALYAIALVCWLLLCQLWLCCLSPPGSNMTASMCQSIQHLTCSCRKHFDFNNISRISRLAQCFPAHCMSEDFCVIMHYVGAFILH